MVDAIVTLLLNTGLRVDELVTLTWQRVNLQPRSGWIDVIGKGDKRRRLPLNSEARKVLDAILPTPADNAEPSSAGSVDRTRRAGSSTSLPNSDGGQTFPMCIHIAFDTTRPGAWSNRSICPPWRPGLVMNGWIRCGSTVNPTKRRLSEPPPRWSNVDTDSTHVCARDSRRRRVTVATTDNLAASV